jgi:hypothetical protein
MSTLPSLDSEVASDFRETWLCESYASAKKGLVHPPPAFYPCSHRPPRRPTRAPKSRANTLWDKREAEDPLLIISFDWPQAGVPEKAVDEIQGNLRF